MQKALSATIGRFDFHCHFSVTLGSLAFHSFLLYVSERAVETALDYRSTIV
jgi:hypothetical protein